MSKIIMLSLAIPFSCLLLNLCVEDDVKQLHNLLKRAEKCLEKGGFDTLIDEIIVPNQIKQLLESRERDEIVADFRKWQPVFLDTVRSCQKIEPKIEDKLQNRRAHFELPKPIDGHTHFNCEQVDGKWYISLG